MNVSCSFLPIAGLAEPGLAYSEYGSPQGSPVVVLLHGFTDSRHSFDLLLPHLPASWRVLTPTFRGHGDSAKLAPDFSVPNLSVANLSVASMVSDILALLDFHEIPAVHLTGHSYGATVALELANRYPHRVLSLSLIGAFFSPGDNPGLREFFEAEVAPLQDPVPLSFIENFQGSTLALSVPEEFFSTVVSESAKLSARTWREVLAGMLSHRPNPPSISERIPLALYWGAKDGYAKEQDQVALADKLRQAKRITYPDLGHCPHWEAPKLFAANFISELVAAERASS